MGSRGDNSLPAFGFLTVVEHEQHGLFGGYLILNSNGRPLEFHCTAPVKANRAQEILYGPTLEPYLYGEQIGQALLAKGQARASVVFTDLVPVLAVRQFATQPVALVLDEKPAAEESSVGDAERIFRLDSAHESGPALPAFAAGCNRLALPAGHAGDLELVTAELAAAPHFDLLEPFGRIRGAIEEAQRGGR